MVKSLLLLLGWGVIGLQFAYAQEWEPYFHLYNKASGLKSEVSNYHLFQDRNGVIWMTAAGGIMRYDSKKFDHFWTTEKGLAERSQTRGYEDYSGRLWFVGMGGKITCFEDGKFFPFKYSDRLSEFLAWGKTTSFHIDSSGTIHIAPYGVGYLQMDTSGVVSEVCMPATEEQGIYFMEIDGQPFAFYLSSATIPNPRIPIFHYHGDEAYRVGYLYEPHEVDSKSEHVILRIMKRRNGNFIIAKDNLLAEVTTDSMFVYGFDRPFVAIAEDRNGGLWLSSLTKHGVLHLPSGDLRSMNKKEYLSGDRIHCIIEDDIGGLWLSSQDKGLYHRPNPDFNYMKKPDLLSEIEKQSPDVLKDFFFGCRDGGRIHANNGEVSYAYKVPGYEHETNFLHNDLKNGRVFFGGAATLLSLENSRIQVFSNESNNIVGRVRSSCFDENSSDFWFSAGSLIYRFVDDRFDLVSSQCPFEIQSICFFENEIYAATINGLWKYSNDEWVDLRALSKETNGRISYLMKYDGHLWVFGYQSGTVRINTKGESIPVLVDARPLNYVVFSEQSGDSLFLSTTLGNLYQVRKAEPGKYSFESIVTPAYFRADLCYKIGKKGGQLFIDGRGDIYRFNMKTYETRPTMPLNINSIAINGSLEKLKSSYSLPSDSNNLSINFSAINFESKGPSHYEYRMSHVDDWTRTEGNDIRYTILPSGNYQFDVRAFNRIGQSSYIKSVQFDIMPPYYATWWFRTLMVLAILGISWWLFRLRINQVKKRSRLLEELHSSQHQALAARMNPHFIFNALNSIQQFTLNNDKERAAAYMREYAHLMRLVLENSSDNLVNLESELEAMQIYLDLERLRSRDRITFSIQQEAGFDKQDYVLPALLLQPYLENAVWHGLMPKSPPGGHIEVKLDARDNALLITIEDNGIGRKQAGALHTGNHPGFESKGTAITQRRIELIEMLYRIEIRVEIEDGFDLEGKEMGTCVRLVIPQPG